ncbi:hypothetical protein [Streptomyces sp. NPDC008137]|uniref:hypothetical protein n=1 Tax=Streptomyces sp. NPDC008137 TaxID=3364813 RepID=UPI0036E8E644
MTGHQPLLAQWAGGGQQPRLPSVGAHHVDHVLCGEGGAHSHPGMAAAECEPVSGASEGGSPVSWLPQSDQPQQDGLSVLTLD